jgi:hypothetical protein
MVGRCAGVGFVVPCTLTVWVADEVLLDVVDPISSVGVPPIWGTAMVRDPVRKPCGHGPPLTNGLGLATVPGLL